MMVMNGLYCDDMQLRNCSLAHSVDLNPCCAEGVAKVAAAVDRSLTDYLTLVLSSLTIQYCG